jgi:phage terminase small subunit
MVALLHQILARGENWGGLSEAMRALTPKQRQFVWHYVIEVGKKPYGAQTRAARKAGYGTTTSDARAMAQMAYQVISDPKVQVAIEEEARKIIRVSSIEASHVFLATMRDKKNPQQLRAASFIMERAWPAITHQNVNVLHQHVLSSIDEELEEYVTLKKVASPEKLKELFGGNRLPVLEDLEKERAQKMKTIEGEVIENE